MDMCKVYSEALVDAIYPKWRMFVYLVIQKLAALQLQPHQLPDEFVFVVHGNDTSPPKFS